MNLLQRMWQDVRRGDNIDLYITLAVAIVLVVLNVIGVAPPPWIVSVSLSVLALVSFTILGNRHRLDMLLQHMPAQSERLLTEFPQTLINDLNEAKTMFIFGADLNRTIKRNYARLIEKLQRGDVIKILLVNPDSPACEMAAAFHYEPMTLEDKRAAVNRSLRMCHEPKKQTAGNLEIRLANHCPTFGAFAVDLGASNGIIYLWAYNGLGASADFATWCGDRNDFRFRVGRTSSAGRDRVCRCFLKLSTAGQ